jgi:3-phenylpropionate/trans-cinnamate dioxygenase ferredoxin reductase subunit
VQNAHDQAATVVKTLCGEPVPYRSVPWFWSNQYDLRLQTVGIATGYDALVLRGDPATRSFSVAYLRGGRIAALDCINATRDYVQARKLIGAQVDSSRLAEPSIALKDLS